MERSIQSSALSHYHAFIDSADALAEVQQQLARAVASLEGLSASVPELAGTFDAFARDAAGIMKQHAANKQLLSECAAQLRRARMACACCCAAAQPAQYVPSSSAQQLTACRRRRRRARATHLSRSLSRALPPAAQQATLLELLDAPQLMDTCVRNGIYDEALDLAAFISRVSLLHPDLPVVQLLAAQVGARARAARANSAAGRSRHLQQLQRWFASSTALAAAGAGCRRACLLLLLLLRVLLLPLQAQGVSQAMLGQLLQRLRTNVQLPECLRVVGYLRRMAAFPEADLRLHFLRCRCAAACARARHAAAPRHAHAAKSAAASGRRRST